MSSDVSKTIVAGIVTAATFGLMFRACQSADLNTVAYAHCAEQNYADCVVASRTDCGDAARICHERTAQ